MSASVILAMRQADIPEPAVPSQGKVCKECEAPVWVSNGTLEGVEEHLGEFTIICTQCLTAAAPK